MRAESHSLTDLLKLTLLNPRLAAESVLALRLPINVRWMTFALVAVLSTLLVHIGFAMQPAELKEFFGSAFGGPIRTTALQAGFMLLGVTAMYQVGRLMGGKGRFEDALVLITWLQAVLLVAQAVQMLAFLLVPVVGDLLGLGTIVLLFWLLTHFVAALHGFKSLPVVFAGILITMVGMVLILAVAMVFLLGPQLGV